MRPGQLTPENDVVRIESGLRRGGFNEAGAINPGKRSFGFRSARVTSRLQ